jgi:hypothetical protein
MCVVGISLISKFITNISHTDILLNNKTSHDLRKKGVIGILIEYGDYSTKMSKVKKIKIKVYVIYSNSLRIIL